MQKIWPWVAFNVVVLILLAIDLGVFNRKAHVITVMEAARWTGITVVLASIFAFAIYFGWLPVEGLSGSEPALQFVTGYLIELALSVDNIFVFVLIFSYFKVPPQFQHRVLFWGVLGALIMRGTLIGVGAFVLERFHWVIYVFGAFLVFTGIRMATQEETDIEPESNPIIRLVRRFMPIAPTYDGQKFFTTLTVNGVARRAATPLFVVLLLVETTDLIFALDSIPAIFAITRDPYIVYTSNVFAILALRSLYFLLAGIIDRFHYLKLGLSIVLVFIGAKMLLTAADIHIPIGISLGVVAGVLTLSVVGSLVFPKSHGPPEVSHDPLDPSDDPPGPVLPPHDTER